MINCPNCNSKKTKNHLVIKSYNLDVCQDCGLLFTREQFSSDRKKVNSDIYNDVYLDNYEERYKYLRKRFLQRVNQIEQRKTGGKILDFGCSNGMFLNIFKMNAKYNWKFFGIDVNKKSIKRAKQSYKDITFQEGYLTNFIYKKNFFDAITCFDVLEHDTKINSTLVIFNNILTKGGLLVIQSPNYKSIMAKLCGNNWDWWSVPDHVYHFTPKYMETFLNQNGFSVINSKTWDPAKEFVYNILGTYRKNNNNFFGKIIAKILIPLLYLLWIVTIPFKLWFGQGGLLLIIAQKNE